MTYIRKYKYRKRKSYNSYRPYNNYGTIYGQGKYYVKSKPKKVYARRRKNKTGGNVGKAVGEFIGGSLGSLVPGIGGVASLAGKGIGGVVGKGIENVFKSITGMGEYKIKSNSLMGTDPPIMHSGKNNMCIRIKHREFLFDLVTSNQANTFLVRQIQINPTKSLCFPWLSSIATQYQVWKPMGICFEFKSTSGDALNSVNTALGTVIMCTDYNSIQKPPQNKQQMENTQYATSCKPSESMIHCIECDPAVMVLDHLYTNKTVQQNFQQDVRFENLGNLYVATSGMQGTSVNVGEVWVTYDIALYYPIENANTALFGDHYILGTSATTSAYFGATLPSAPSSDSNLGTTLTNTSIKFPQGFVGNVMVYYQLVGGSTAFVQPTLTGTNGATVLNVLVNDTSNVGGINTTSTLQTNTSFWSIIDQGNGTIPTITFSIGTLVTSSTSGDLIIAAIQNAV